MEDQPASPPTQPTQGEGQGGGCSITNIKLLNKNKNDKTRNYCISLRFILLKAYLLVILLPPPCPYP